ncbi:MAG: hypothetical protein M1381_02680 [Deltaproteobacteria bacterium]|nr:hypothetical protein [Deltaproteobacteria bacterium]MCL5792014.1 hypothetical protein [Deltaproteobacteria bacterium]
MMQKTYNPVNRRYLTLFYILVLLAMPSIGYTTVLFNFDQDTSSESISDRVTSSEGFVKWQGQDPFYTPINSPTILQSQHSQQSYPMSKRQSIDDNPDTTAIIPNMTSFIIYTKYTLFEAVILFKPEYFVKAIFHPPPAAI